MSIDDLQPMWAVLLLPDDCLELAQRKSEESELGNEKWRILVNNTYEGGCKDALSTGAGEGKGKPQTAQFRLNNGLK